LIDALKYVTTLAGLKYRIESSAVIILPLDAPEGEMVTRSYPVTPGVFKAPTPGAGTGVGTANATPTGAVGSYRAIGENQAAPAVVASNEVQNTFRSAGVPFPPGSSLVYNSRTSTIIIRNTPENLEVFERVLSAYNFIPSQIEIEAKFVQVSQNDLDQLGFDWQVGTKTVGSFDVTGGSGVEAFPPGSGPLTSGSYDLTSGQRGPSSIQGNAIASLLAEGGLASSAISGVAAASPSAVGTIRGILTNPQFQLVINALAQKQSSDTLSAPKVTTVSGQQAQIRSVQEFIYPTSWAQPTATSSGGGVTGGGAVAVTPSIPSSFQTREVGVLLNVTPEVGADGYTINLTLSPEVSEFLGFINYGSPIGLSSGVGNVVTTMNNIEEPLFSSQNLTTSVTIWDGQTVVLGGLITEQLTKIDDKVPFLGDLPLVGRLFQSKVTQRSKLNLLVFVTARLIDPAGNPIHRLPVASSARY
jgi:general secretion pathway protein D